MVSFPLLVPDLTFTNGIQASMLLVHLAGLSSIILSGSREVR